MNNSDGPFTEAELHAWVDGRLAPGRSAELAAWLTGQPAQAARLQAYREQNAALRRRYQPVLEEAVPAALLAPAARRRPPLLRYAAMLALTLAGGAAGWLLREATAPGPGPTLAAAEARPAALAHRAAVAHAVYTPERRHPVEVGADQQQHLVAWLSKRLDAPLRPPQLEAQGFLLEGGRLLPGASGPVAQLMYSNSSGLRLTLYVSTEQRGHSGTGFRFAKEGELGVFYWIDGKFGYALSGQLDRQALGQIADAVYAQLEPQS